jgi:membrane-associated phospholipid phosphatase
MPQSRDTGQDIKDDQDNQPLSEKVEEGAQGLVKEARKEIASAHQPWYRIAHWGRILLIFYAVVFVLFGLLAWWVHVHPVLSIDVTITREFQENQTPWLKFLMEAVSYQGYNLWLAIGLILVAAIAFWLVDLRLEAIVVIASAVASALVNGLVKIIVDRPRPTAHVVTIIQGAGGPSFPSGHVMSYVAYWGLLFTFGIILFRGARWWRTSLIAISALIVVLIGPSRIYLGDHWASDVLGAYMIGGALLGITLWIYLKLKERGVLAPRRQLSWYRHARSWRSPLAKE